MAEYTEAQRNAINAAYAKIGRDEPLTPDELQTVIAFEREQAASEALASKRTEELMATMEQERKAKAEQAAIAAETLRLERDAAMERYRRSLGHDQK